ncbi:phospholipid carrier-dependent glycosyltransferase [bacterium]|jgi:hypothetical protein|nr:phospholipid carrier-dependent glycosyltransferase [bacterium]
MILSFSDEGFKKVLISFFLLVFASISLYRLGAFPTVLYDEPMYANTAYFFATHSKFFNSLTGYSGQEFFLYPGIVSVFLKGIPSTLYGFRKINLIFGLVSVFLFSNLCIKLLKSRAVIFGTVACFVFSNIVFIAHRIVRPESFALMFCMFTLFYGTSYLALLRDKDVFLLGLTMSLLSLVHPICVVFYISFIIPWFWILIKNKIFLKSLAPFVLGHLPTLILSLIYFKFWSIYSPQEWIDAVIGSGRIPGRSIFLGFFDNLVWVYKGYVMGTKRAFLVAIEFFVVAWGLTQFKRNHFVFFLSVVTLLYFVFSQLLFQPYLRPYYTLLIPSIVLLIGLFVDRARVKRPTFILVVFLYAGYSLLGNVYLFWMNRSNDDYDSLKKEVVKSLPSYENIFINSHYFWFWFKSDARYGHEFRGSTQSLENHDLYILNFESNPNSNVSGGSSRIPKLISWAGEYDVRKQRSLVKVTVSESYGRFEVWQ